jgi:DNA-binding LytR/AlgR family response regulator
MKKSKTKKTEKPQGKRPGGNNLQTPAKPPSEEMKKALSDLAIIILITVVDNYIRIFYSTKGDVFVKGTLKTALELCKVDYLMKTHRSFIANLNFGIEYYIVGDNYKMPMSNTEIVIVGSDYRKEFDKKIESYSNCKKTKNPNNKK